VRLLGIPQEKIQVIYPGVPEAYFSIDQRHVERVRAELRLGRRYLLYVGTSSREKMSTCCWMPTATWLLRFRANSTW